MPRSNSPQVAAVGGDRAGLKAGPQRRLVGADRVPCLHRHVEDERVGRAAEQHLPGEVHRELAADGILLAEQAFLIVLPEDAVGAAETDSGRLLDGGLEGEPGSEAGREPEMGGPAAPRPPRGRLPPTAWPSRAGPGTAPPSARRSRRRRRLPLPSARQRGSRCITQPARRTAPAIAAVPADPAERRRNPSIFVCLPHPVSPPIAGTENLFLSLVGLAVSLVVNQSVWRGMGRDTLKIIVIAAAGQAVSYGLAVLLARRLGIAGFEAYVVASAIFIVLVALAPAVSTNTRSAPSPRSSPAATGAWRGASSASASAAPSSCRWRS